MKPRMKDPRLTHDLLLTLLRYEPETGNMIWVANRTNSHIVGRVAGTISDTGYRIVRVLKILYPIHRIIWFYIYKEWPENEIDHIDGNKANNRIENLRLATRAQNMQNKRVARADNKIGVLGVSMHKGRLMAQIQAGGKKKFLGYFETAEEAHAAYVAAKRRLHEGCTI